MKAGIATLSNVLVGNPQTIYDPAIDGRCSGVQIENTGGTTINLRETHLHGTEWFPLAAGASLTLVASSRNIGVIEAYGNGTLLFVKTAL
jgi:hypothetical protein